MSLDRSSLPWPLAAPSWVIPGTLAENVRFLAGQRDLVDEVGLLLLESEACLAYGNADLPRDLAGLGLAVHTHLPVDLPWDAGAHQVLDTVLRLADKVAYLRPNKHVLHPPPHPGLLDAFLSGWRDHGRDPHDICVENTLQDDLSSHLTIIEAHQASICLDLGHLLMAGQHALLGPEILARTRLAHVNAPAPDGSSRHASLATLDREGGKALRGLLKGLLPASVLMLELFAWDEFQDSLRCLLPMARAARAELAAGSP